MRRSVMTMGLVMAVAVAGWAGTVVFKNGSKLEVKEARLASGMVLVTLPDGSMRAYAAGDVDLEASGLETPRETPPEAPRRAGPRSLAEFAGQNRGAARVTLTDADVEHVESPSEDETAASPSGGKVPSTLEVAVQGYSRRGDQLTVRGRVVNRAEFPVSAVRLEAVATGPDGKVVGRAEKEIGGQIPPGGAAGFAITMTLGSETVAGVTVRVSGALAAAKVAPPRTPPPPSGGVPAEGEG